MGIDDTVDLIEALAHLLAAVAWPTLFAIVLIRFGPALKDFFTSLGELSLKGAGFEATARRRAEVAAALAAANVAQQTATTSATTARSAGEVSQVADLVSYAVTPRVLRRTSHATVLWVDDSPNHNMYERQSLEALGVHFVLARSTDEALRRVKGQHFDAIISDMSRPPDALAGYTLLDALREAGVLTPVIIYSSSSDSEHKAEARRHGAMAQTNRADELFNYVLEVLTRP